MISEQGDKCFAVYVLLLGSFFFLLILHWKHWCLILDCWLQHVFGALIGNYLVPLLIIVELFLWSARPMVFTLTLRGYPR